MRNCRPLAQELCESRSLHLGLFAGRKRFYRQNATGGFVFAQDDNCARDFVRSLERFLQPEGSIAHFDEEAGASEVAGEGEGCGVSFHAHWGDVGVEFVGNGCGFGLGLEGEDEAVFADGEADSGGLGAAEHLGEAVVAAAT